MSEFAAVERLLSSLPKIEIGTFPVGTAVPRQKSVKPLLDYNGFSGLARMRTWDVAKWLMAGGQMPNPCTCDLCGLPADQYHAENYFDFSSYVPICRSCHGKLHSRLRNFNTWLDRRGQFAKPEDHWVNLLTDRALPVAEWCSANKMHEPQFSDFVQSSG